MINIILMLIIDLLCYRVQIAILHFNENANREQATTLEGKERFDVLFPKYKAGGYVVKRVKVDPTFSKLTIIVSGTQLILMLINRSMQSMLMI